MFSSNVIVNTGGTDWGTVIAAGLGSVGTLAGVIIGSRSSKRAEAEAVRRDAYAAFLTAVAPIVAQRKQLLAKGAEVVSKEDWHNLRATRYAAQLVGSATVARLARELSSAVNEPQAVPGADFSGPFGRLINAMQADLQRQQRWRRRRKHASAEGEDAKNW
jgi:hypothetical protein